MLCFPLKFQGIWISDCEVISQRSLNIFYCIVWENRLEGTKVAYLNSIVAATIYGKSPSMRALNFEGQTALGY